MNGDDKEQRTSLLSVLKGCQDSQGGIHSRRRCLGGCARPLTAMHRKDRR